MDKLGSLVMSLMAGMAWIADYKWIVVWLLIISIIWINKPSLLFGED